VNAFTTVTSSFPIQGELGFYAVYVGDSTWMVDPGQVLAIEGGGAAGGVGYYKVAGYISAIHVILQNMKDTSSGAYLDNLTTGTISAGAKVSPAGIQGPAGLPVEVTSGAPDPTVDPSGGASGLYVQSGASGTYWYYNGTGGGPWIDTGISVTGPAGATGATGAAGHTPVVTTVTSNPTAAGGAAGDIRWYQPVGNNGFTTIYYNLAGTWTQGPTILANRLIGYSTTSILPNPAGVAANVGDQYWAYDGSDLYFFVCSVAGSPGTWATAMVLPISGGGGVGTFQQVSDASPVLAAGRRTGTRIWTMERSIQLYPQTVNITSLLTTTLDTAYQWQKISIQVVSFAIDWSPVSSNVNCEWIFEFTNNYAGQATIDYVNNRWSKSPGVTHPIILNPGEVATLHCYNIKGKMNIAFVEQNLTAI
jgi:hypothetical protein